MKKLLLLFLLITSAVAYSQQADQKRVPFMTIQMIEPWKREKIQMIKLDSGGNGAAQEAVAEYASYTFKEPPKSGIASSIGKFYILKIHDISDKRYIFIDPSQSVYLTDISGTKGYLVGPGDLIWSGSYLEVPDSLTESNAVREFELSFDAQKYNQEWDKRGKANRIPLRQAAPKFYFSDGPHPGGGTPLPRVLKVSMTNNVLDLKIENPVTKVPATFLVDLKAKRVIKSIVNGQEMDLSVIGSEKPFTVPFKK